MTLTTGDLAGARSWFDKARAAGRMGLTGLPGGVGTGWLDARTDGAEPSLGLLAPAAVWRSVLAERPRPDGEHTPLIRIGEDLGRAVDSAFLEIFLLDGLAELALAEGDAPGAAATFAVAVARLQTVGERARRGELGRGMGATAGVAATLATFDVLGLVTGSRGAEVIEGFIGMPVASQVVQDASDPAPAASATRGGPRGGLFTPTSADVGDRVLVPSVLAGTAKVAVALGAHERAARLFGAGEHLRGSTSVLHRQGRWILFEHRYEQFVTEAREALGDASFDAAFADGQAMSADAALDYAGHTLR